MAKVQQLMTDRETEECWRYWEERIRTGQQRGRELDQSLVADRLPETPGSLENGNLARESESQNAGRARGSGYQAGQALGNLAQAQLRVADEIAGLRKRRRGNLAGPAPHASPRRAGLTIPGLGAGLLTPPLF